MLSQHLAGQYGQQKTLGLIEQPLWNELLLNSIQKPAQHLRRRNIYEVFSGNRIRYSPAYQSPDGDYPPVQECDEITPVLKLLGKG